MPATRRAARPTRKTRKACRGCLQAQYNPVTRQTELEPIPGARHNGLGILAWSPLASGFLTGKYGISEQRSPGTRAGQDHALYQYASSNYETPNRTWTAADAVRQFAGTTGVSPAQVALTWVLDRPGVVSAIIGARNTPQLAGNLAATGVHLDAAATAILDVASDPYPYGPFGSAQRDRTANGPEALSALAQAHANGDHDGVHPAR
jgi:aryl-alcohol dehydrogenase-like predicted oxidoreductase